MSDTELDFSDFGPFTPPDIVLDKYKAVIPQVAEANHLGSAQEALARIRQVEVENRTKLFGINISDEATPLQRMPFERKLLKVRHDLGIATEEEAQKQQVIEEIMAAAVSRLATSRGIPEDEADDILSGVLAFKDLASLDDAVERLAKGPKIEGFGRTEIPGLDLTNEAIGEFLEAAFDREAFLKARILEISKTPGYKVNCPDIEYANSCVREGRASRSGNFLVFPDRQSYEVAEMHLEGVSDRTALEHTYKLRASTSTDRYTTITFNEFIGEHPSQFDYLSDLPLSEEDKMRVYYLGLVQHEVFHGMQAYTLDDSVMEEYKNAVQDEFSEELSHRFVTKYVDRHASVFQSSERLLFSEDSAEAVRIFSSNAEFLRHYYPKRFTFIQRRFPFIKENAARNFV